MVPRSTLPTIEVDVSTIIVGEDRIRTDFGDIDDLANSIRENGLIQPIVVTSDHRLIAGERRLRAHRLLNTKTIKVVYLECVDEAHKTILEATENIVRKQFSWQEHVLAIDKVHRHQSTIYALKSEAWGVRETGRMLNTAKSSIQRATFIATYIRANDPEVINAGGLKEAFAVLLKRREDELARALVASSLPRQTSGGVSAVPVVRKEITDDEFFSTLEASSGSTGFTPGVGSPIDLDERPGMDAGVQGSIYSVRVPLSQMFFQGDAVEFTKTLAAETFDAVITDWPYGNDPDMMEHAVDLTDLRETHGVDYCKDLHARIVPEIYRVLKPNAWFITWTDMDLWEHDKQLALAAGFKVQRWPLTWHKTSSCSNGAAQFNFTKNSEIALVCRKGNALLTKQQPSSVWSGGSDAESKALGHAFAKPFGLWEWIYSATCLRGASVYDPFVGSGSSSIPAIRLGLRPVGVETNETIYGKLSVNLRNFYKSLDPDCDFS